MKRRRIAIAVVVLVLVAIGALWALRSAVIKGWIRYNEYDIRSEGLLQVGDLAPDLDLENVDGSGKRRLSDFYSQKPTVLAFGSYT